MSVDGQVLSTEVRTKTEKNLIFANRNDRGGHRNISVKYLLSVGWKVAYNFRNFFPSDVLDFSHFFGKP